MADSATLKVDRAAKHVADLNDLFRKKRPFSYVVETNTQTRKRATFAKKNEPIIAEGGLIIGDAIHNLRSALDHAYWEIVSPVATGDAERRQIQFPFAAKAAGLDEAIKQRLADRVSPQFFAALQRLRPHGEPGGNELLYLIHELNLLDKHKLLIPTGDYTRISSEIIRRQVPDFPSGLHDVGFGQGHRDVVWAIGTISPDQFERELDVPVEIVFAISSPGHSRPVVPTLNALVDVAKEAISLIRTA